MPAGFVYSTNYERICDAKPQTAFVILDFCDLTDYDTAKKSLLRLEEKEKYSVLYVVFITTSF